VLPGATDFTKDQAQRDYRDHDSTNPDLYHALVDSNQEEVRGTFFSIYLIDGT
jgi:hypothetical protein